MQIPPSGNLFRALGGMSQPSTAVTQRTPAANTLPEPVSTGRMTRLPASTTQSGSFGTLVAGDMPAQKPAGNLPRGSLINIKV